MTASRNDQARTAFTPILEALLGSLRGSLAAAMVDEDGELVDQAKARSVGTMDPFDVGLAAAHWQLVGRDCQSKWSAGHLLEMTVDTEHRSYWLRRLPDGYCLVVVGEHGACWDLSPRAARQAVVDVALEASMSVPDPHELCWTRVSVRLDAQGCPEAICVDGRWRERVDVAHQARRPPMPEEGVDVLLDGGLALRLVREQSGNWYAGKPLSAGR